MRNGKIITAAIALLFVLLFFTHEAKAQTVTGYTAIDYYEDTNTVDAYSETDEDYDVESAYGAYVSLTVTDQNGNLMGWETASDDGTYGYAAVEIQFSGTPSTTYTAMGMHKTFAQQYDYYYDYNQLYGTIFYFDYFYFSSFENQGIVEPYFFAFSGPGPMVTRPNPQIILGATHDAASVTTPGQPDHVEIVNDVTHVTQPCDIVERVVYFKVVDASNRAVSTFSLRESDSTVVDTCDNQVPDYIQTCTPLSGTYGDALSAACPRFGDYDCGYDIPNEQHLWCSGNGLVPLATFDYNVRHDRIIVSGYTGRLPLKWFVRADGSIKRK